MTFWPGLTPMLGITEVQSLSTYLLDVCQWCCYSFTSASLLIAPSKLLRRQAKSLSAGPRGQGRLCLCFTVPDRDSSLFVWPAMRTSSVFCLWCPRARGQVGDRRSLCTALCPLPASYREAALCCYMEEKQNGRDTEPLTPRLWQRGRGVGSCPGGRSAFPAVNANWWWWEKLFSVIVSEQLPENWA